MEIINNIKCSIGICEHIDHKFFILSILIVSSILIARKFYLRKT